MSTKEKALAATASALEETEQLLSMLVWKKGKAVAGIRAGKRHGLPHFKRDRARLTELLREETLLRRAVEGVSLARLTVEDVATAPQPRAEESPALIPVNGGHSSEQIGLGL